MQVNDVSKSFINFRLQDINLFLDKGQILGYIGPNGAGKTTTIKIIMFFASTFWRKMQNIFGECCISKLEKVARPRLAAILPAT